MTRVVFDQYSFHKKTEDGAHLILDPVRRKYVALTPEEWVRQHVIRYLIDHLKVPRSLLAVEKQLNLNGLKKRTDVVVYNQLGLPLMIVECKSYQVPLNDLVIAQIVRYNQTLRVDYLWLTNGEQHYCYRIRDGIQLCEHIPSYQEMLQRPAAEQ